MPVTRRRVLQWSLAATAAAGLSRLDTRSWAHAQETGYTLTDLVTFDGELVQSAGFSVPGSGQALNEAGEIGGSLAQTAKKMGPVIWSAAGKPKRLKSAGFGGEVRALSNTGYAVGAGFLVPLGVDAASMNSNTVNFIPLAWLDGTPMTLPTPAGWNGDVIGWASAVNDAGVIVGTLADNETKLRTAVVWTEDGYQELTREEPDSNTYAESINAAGVIGGLADVTYAFDGVDFQPSLAFPATWTDGAMTILEHPEDHPEAKVDDLGLAAVFVFVTDSDLVVVGYVGRQGTASYIYDRGKPTRLASPSKDHPLVMISAVSANGQICGLASTEDYKDRILVRWAEDGTPINLNELVPELADYTSFFGGVIAINNAGTLLLKGQRDGLNHLLTLTPA